MKCICKNRILKLLGGMFPGAQLAHRMHSPQVGTDIAKDWIIVHFSMTMFLDQNKVICGVIVTL